MAIFKCKMCGGNLEIQEGMSVCECEYCGSKQTVPNLDDEKKVNLFSRANRLRQANEFDKASGVYESIITEFPEEAEAYWGLLLCKYGIEYVDDPKTGKKIPTCHRSSFDSIMEDPNFDMVMECSDLVSRAVYRSEAKAIEELRIGIIEVSSKEEPYDIFICYKETDATGERTIDSVIAQEVYDALTEKGYKVFFSRITLEDKLGQEYEPYIFAALNSAKVMLAFGTDYEYYNAVWVKNEWSRFLSLIAKGEKKTLIPCYKGIDAYDMPKEFTHLQAQDMGKVGAIQDLLRGIGKIIETKTQQSAPAPVNGSANANAAPLLKRAFMFLEDGDWNSADEYCEKVLDLDPENAEAYLGKLMAELKIHNKDKLKNAKQPFDENGNAVKASKFDDKIAAKIKADNDFIRARIENARKEGIYNEAVAAMKAEEYDKAAKLFESIAGFKDADALLKQCFEAVEAQKQKARLEAQKARLEAERAKEIVPVLLTGKDYSDKQSLKDSFSDAEQKERQLSALLNDFDSIAGQRKQIEPQIASNEALIKSLTEQRASLGIFAGKEKKRIDEEIIVQKDKNASLKKEHAALSGRLCGFAKKEDVENALEAARKGVAGIEKQIENARLAQENEQKYDEALATLKNDEALANAVADVLIAGGYYSALNSLLLVSGIFSRENQQKCYNKIARSAFISSGREHTVGLKADGTVVATEYITNTLDKYHGQCDVKDWKDIVAVAAGSVHTVGLKKGGTVVATGYNVYGQCDVKDWTDIVAVSAGFGHTVGLKKDGTVVVMGGNYGGQCNVKGLTDIVAVAAGDEHTVGLKKGGTVVATGSNKFGQCDVDGWKDIVAVTAGEYHTVGLKADGTVVATGSKNVKGWKDIVAVAAGRSHTVGLKTDGTVVATGSNTWGQCNVKDWKDIVAVAAGTEHTVGLKKDGTVVATKYIGDPIYNRGQCDVKGWKDIKLF